LVQQPKSGMPGLPRQGRHDTMARQPHRGSAEREDFRRERRAVRLDARRGQFRGCNHRSTQLSEVVESDEQRSDAKTIRGGDSVDQRLAGMRARIEAPRQGRIMDKSQRRVLLASAVGSALEWYDFFIYGTAAALVFGDLFFPKLDPTVGTLAAFATFGVGFFARPFGGMVFGHFGDRIGRKPMLVLTVIL